MGWVRGKRRREVDMVWAGVMIGVRILCVRLHIACVFRFLTDSVHSVFCSTHSFNK